MSVSSLYVYELLENKSRIISTSISGSKAGGVGPSPFYVRDICYRTPNRYTTKLGGPAHNRSIDLFPAV